MAVLPQGSEDLLTTTEAADLVGVHRQTVISWLRTGRLQPVATIKQIRLLRREEVEAVATTMRLAKLVRNKEAN